MPPSEPTLRYRPLTGTVSHQVHFKAHCLLSNFCIATKDSTGEKGREREIRKDNRQSGAFIYILASVPEESFSRAMARLPIEKETQRGEQIEVN